MKPFAINDTFEQKLIKLECKIFNTYEIIENQLFIQTNLSLAYKLLTFSVR